MVLDSLRGHGAECIETFHPANKTTQTRPVLSHCLRRYPPRRAPRLCCPSKQGKSLRLQPGAMWGANRAPPVAEEASRFRGSAPIGGHDSAGESAGTTVLPRRPSRIFRDRERVRRFCRSSSCIFCRCRREIGEAPPVAEEASRFRGSAPIGRHDSGRQSAGTTVLPRRLSRIFRDRERIRRFCRSSSYTFCRCRRESGEAPPVAEEASRFRGSAPIGGHDSAGESAGTTVLPRRLSRIFRDRERVRRFCRSSSYTSCRCRRGRGHCGRSSAPGGAAFSRCRRRRRSRRWPWPPAHA